MTKTVLSMLVSATGPGVLASIRLDGQEIYHGEPGIAPSNVTHEFDDLDDVEHLLEIELLGKKPEHTKINDSGVIIEDVLVNVSRIKFDDINVDQIVFDLSEYHHDYNGNGNNTIDRFYGNMGCNGVVKLKFKTPIYLWLLESM